MKYILTLTIVCLFGHTFEVDIPDHALTPEDHECMTELGIERNQVEAFFDENYLVILENSLSDNYSECWIKKMNFINEKNDFNFDRFYQYVMNDVLRNLGKKHVKNAESRAREAVDSCRNVKGKNTGNLGSRIYNCVAKAIYNF